MGYGGRTGSAKGGDTQTTKGGGDVMDARERLIQLIREDKTLRQTFCFNCVATWMDGPYPCCPAEFIPGEEDCVRATEWKHAKEDAERLAESIGTHCPAGVRVA